MLFIKKNIKRLAHFVRWNKRLRCLGIKCAYLFATPTHTNIGDSAIVVAEREFLKKCGYEKIIEITAREYEADRPYIKYSLPRKADIFLPGGGNMGSLWPIEEEWRMQIVEDFSQHGHHNIVVFPQTIYYSNSPDALALQKKTIQIYNYKDNLAIVAREKISYDLMKKLYSNLKIIYSPDIVLSMQKQVFNKPRFGILVCFRHDKEQALISSEEKVLINNLRKKFYSVSVIDTMADKPITKDNRDEMVRNKLKQIASARLIITDRLHGMVFAAITGTPCLVLGNNHHKVYGTYEWLKHLDYIRFVYDIYEIEDLVAEYYNKTNCVFSIDSRVFSELGEYIKKLLI